VLRYTNPQPWIKFHVNLYRQYRPVYITENLQKDFKIFLQNFNVEGTVTIFQSL
jgi:hypothetical protein